MANVARMIEVDQLYCEDNVRSPECTAIPAMVESYQRHGFKVNHPLVVSEKTDGRFLVLVGNRRTIALFFIRDNQPDDYGRILAGGKVPAIVHKGLTAEEEVLLRIDHSTDEDRIPLDEWSVFLAVKQLVQIGVDTQENIAEKLGMFYTKGKNQGQPNRSFVQLRVNLARLPQFVQDTIRQYTLDKDSTSLRWSHVAGLSKAYNAEYVEHPAADGPKFKAAWTKATTPVMEEEKDTSKKELTPADAVRRSQAASSEGLKSALLSLTGQSDESLAMIDKAIVEGESALILIGKIKAYLGNDDYAILVTQATEVAEIQEEVIA